MTKIVVYLTCLVRFATSLVTVKIISVIVKKDSDMSFKMSLPEYDQELFSTYHMSQASERVRGAGCVSVVILKMITFSARRLPTGCVLE